MDAESLKRMVGVMNAAADKWHRCGGNWYKVFTACDEDGSGSMDFDEMVSNLRSNYPGLSITQSQLSDSDMRGLWRALDIEKSGAVDVKSFMVFMRQHGKDYSMHKLTAYAKQKRGLLGNDDALGPTPPRSREQLRACAQTLNNTLTQYWERRGIRMPSTSKWDAFFKEAEDMYKAGRFSFFELRKMLQSRLLHRPARNSHNDSMLGTSFSMQSSRASYADDDDTVVRGVSRDDLLALWVDVNRTQVNADGTKKICPHDWYVGLYQVEIEHWPQSDEATLMATADQLSAAADRWHRAAGNWYKVFNLVDSEGAGHFGFQEMVDMIRRPLPCLAVPPERLPDRELKMFWKALDADFSGEVTVTEFMVFMRRLEAKRGISSTPRAAAGSVVQRALDSRLAATAKARSLTAPEYALLRAALARAGAADEIAAAYEREGRPWHGFVSEWDWYDVVRDVLGLGEDQFDDDAVFVAWRLLDPDGTGKVDADSLSAPMHN